MLDDLRVAVKGWEAGTEGLLMSFVGKLPGMAVRLSLVLAYLEWASGEADEPREIDASQFGKAVLLIETYLLPMARRAYADASTGKGERGARRLVALIREQGWREFTSREVLRLNRPGIGSSDELNPAISALEEADIIQALPAPPNPGRGRPVRMFAVNPALFKPLPPNDKIDLNDTNAPDRIKSISSILSEGGEGVSRAPEAMPTSGEI